MLGFIGITNIHRIAVENQEAGGELLAESVKEAERQVDQLVKKLQMEFRTNPQAEPV